MARSPSCSPLADETVELLQALIRNACVNDGTDESGQEIRNVDTLRAYLDGTGLAMETYESAPGRVNLAVKIEGREKDAPSLCLNGHTDVVPVTMSGWSRDPFAGELVDGEVWGRGAVDMLNLTASMAVVMKQLAKRGARPRGDIVFVAVADEESGSKHGTRFLAETQRDLIATDYVLTENGGLHSEGERPSVGVMAAEKGVAWRRLTVRGTPGHGSAPFKANNALIKAAAIIQRLADYRPAPRFHELWRGEVERMGLPDEMTRPLLDETAIEAYLAELPREFGAGHFYSCTHTTFSPNVAVSQTKTNVIPDTVTIDVDVRTMPGDGRDEVAAHLREALGDLADDVEFTPLMNDVASISQTDTPLWDSMAKAVAHRFPGVGLAPRLGVGFTDARIHRELGAVAYGAGLLAPSLKPSQFGSRFHGNDERLDVESIGLTTGFYADTVADFHDC